MDLSEWVALLQKYNLGPQMSADQMNMDKLTGSGTVYNDMFPDSQRQNATDRTNSRMNGINFTDQQDAAREQAPAKMDGCVICQ